MTVVVDASGWSAHLHEHEGTTYHFCCVGCRDRFAADPAAYLTGQEA
jgi:YHS domain-containing protein